MSQPAKLTPTEQAHAIGQWGGPGSFRCCACGNESTDAIPGTVATRVGFHLGTCRPCARRLQISPTYRRQTRERANDAACRTLWQRVADLVGVTGAALVDCMRNLNSATSSATLRTADARLNLPPGSIESAMLQVLGVGPKQ